MDAREGWLIRLRSRNHEGFGEATPLPGWTESRTECREALQTARTVLGDHSISTVLDRLGQTPAARHGISLAWYDLRARRKHEPLYRMLGGPRKVESLAVNAVVDDGSADETMENLRKCLEEGFECVKIKAGARSPEEECNRLRRVARQAEGRFSWRVDANGSWRKNDVDRVLRSVPLDQLDYLEQPLAPENLDDLARLRQNHPVAVDESLGRFGVEEILARDAADVFILKPMALGGPDRCLSAAQRVREGGADVVVTTTLDAVVARCGAVHVAAALDRDRAQGLATATVLSRDLAPDPAPVRDGRISVPPGPGIGTRGGWDE